MVRTGTTAKRLILELGIWLVGFAGFYVASQADTAQSLLPIITAWFAFGLSWFVRDYAEEHRRGVEQANALSSVYLELLDRAWRCSFDFKSPWRSFLGPDLPFRVSSSRIQKFLPVEPIFYQSLVRELGSLGPRAVRAIVRFYTALDGWRRDVSFHAAQRKETYAISELMPLVQWLGWTLAPAAEAIKAMHVELSNADDLDRIFLESLPQDRRPQASIISEIDAHAAQVEELLGGPNL